MSVDYRAVLGVGYIIPKAKAKEIYADYPDFEDNLRSLDGFWYDTDYFFGEIFYECGPGEEREIQYLGELTAAIERVEKTLGSILKISEECPIGVRLVHTVD